MPQALYVWREIHVKESAHQDEQGDPAHLDQHVAVFTVYPGLSDLVSVLPEGRDVGQDTAPDEQWFHVAAQLVVEVAVDDQDTLVQQAHHGVGFIAPEQLVALVDQDLAAGCRTAKDGGLEDGMVI